MGYNITMIENIDRKIEELKEQKKQFNAQMKKLKEQHATKEAIIDGPDRGYTYNKWHDDAAKEVFSKLGELWFKTDVKITRLREAKRKIGQAQKILQEIL